MSTTKSFSEVAWPVASSPRKNPRTKEDVNILVPRNPRSQKSTDQLAQYLVDKLQSPDHRPAFLRYAWRLDEAFIHSTAEVALTNARNPRAYFIASCKRELAKRGLL